MGNRYERSVICVVVLCIAIFAVTVLEKEKKKHG